MQEEKSRRVSGNSQVEGTGEVRTLETELAVHRLWNISIAWEFSEPGTEFL